jgi:serine/threonine protein phosphatase PrpC
MNVYTLQVFGCTDTGNVRPVNEDHILVGRFVKNSGWMGIECLDNDDFLASYGILFAVADGIGGEQAGEVASKITLQTIEGHFYSFERPDANIDTFLDALKASVTRANDTVKQIAASRLECAGMGCTLTGVCITRSGYLVFNAGDSRVYRYRSGFLKQLTDDDTLVNIAVRSGQMTYEEAAVSNARHTITNSIGAPNFNLKIKEGPELRDADRLLICSDGLHDLVPIGRMEEIIGSCAVDEAGRMLLAEAKLNGGTDNISLILLYYTDFEKPEANESVKPEIAQETTFTSESSITNQNDLALQTIGNGAEGGNDYQI